MSVFTLDTVMWEEGDSYMTGSVNLHAFSSFLYQSSFLDYSLYFQEMGEIAKDGRRETP